MIYIQRPINQRLIAFPLLFGLQYLSDLSALLSLQAVDATHFKAQRQKVKSTQTVCMSRQTRTDILWMQTMP